MTVEAIASEEFQAAIAVYCPMGRVGQEGELDSALLNFVSDAHQLYNRSASDSHGE